MPRRRRKLKLAGHQETEVWIRNPKTCIRECRDVGVRNILWYKPYLITAHIDPDAFIRTFYGSAPWRCMVVDPGKEEAVIFTFEKGDERNPLSVHPVWSYARRNINHLEEMMRVANGTGGYVVATALPPIERHNGPGKQAVAALAELQADYPKARLHVSNLYSFPSMYGHGFGSSDFDPRTGASKGNIYLPNGMLVHDAYEAERWRNWLRMIGYTPSDLAVPRNRCMLNITSALWAGRYYRVNKAFRVRGFGSSGEDLVYQRAFFRNHAPQPGDLFYCGSCSMAEHCRFYREGSVCSVPGTEGERLAELFESRDGDRIIEGLGALVGMQAKRISEGMDQEADSPDGIDPHVSKLIESTFKMGAELGKLIDPNRFNPKAPGVQNNTQINITGGDTKKLTAKVVKALNERGVATADITPEMIERILKSNPDDFDKEIMAIAEKAGA